MSLFGIQSPLTIKMTSTQDRTCRICLEDDSANDLISPCRCSGSLSEVHELCLKTWLISKNNDMHNAKCEICQTVLLMSLLVSVRCRPREAMKEGLAHCLFLPLLITVLAILALITFVLSVRMGEDDQPKKTQWFTLGLILICAVSSLVIMALIVNAVREACFLSSLSEWRIFD